MVKPKLKSRENSMVFLTENEFLAREQRHMQRLQDVRISVAFIHHANKKYEDLKAEQLELDKWNDYLACDGMPRPDLPSEIRSFLYKLRHDEHAAVAADINWVLSVNEQSILTHAPDRQDLTRRHLEVTKPNIGKFYEQMVQGILQTHKRVERVLRNESELLSMPPLRVLELTKIPGELHEEINTFFDKLAYRVICAPETYMINKSYMLSSYCYNCSHFNFQMWSLQDVPIRFQYMRLPLMYSDLKCIEATIQLPLSVLSDNLTLRCVHTFFDSCSHLAKSYNLSIDTQTSPNCGILEIEDSLTSEWLAQMDIQDHLIMKMDAEMEAYNEAMAAIELAVAAKQKKQAENEKGPSVPKAPKVPLTLPEGNLPDPYPLFLKQYRRERADFFNDNFHPDNINLLEYEVNLRRNMILGGVFSIVFVRKPRRTAFEKLNLTLHKDGSVLQVVLDRLDRSEDQKLTRPNLDMDARDSDHNLHLAPDELPYYFITFTVPKHLCLWADPLVCQFVEEEIELPTIEEEVLLEEVDKKPKKRRRRKPTEPTKMKEAATKPSSSKEMDEAATMSESTIRHPNPSFANIYNVRSLDIIRKSLSETKAINNESVQNFALNVEPLSPTEAHLVNKICMPRIISSFKFPLEFKDEQQDDHTPTKASGPIFRRRLTETNNVEEITESTLNYEDQAEPERLYPIFSQPEDSSKLRKYEHASKLAEDPSLPHANLFGLVRTLDGIKEKYEESTRKLEEQTAPQGVRMSKRHISDSKEIPSRGAVKGNFSARNSSSLVSVSLEREIEKGSREADIKLKRQNQIKETPTRGAVKSSGVRKSGSVVRESVDIDINSEEFDTEVKSFRRISKQIEAPYQTPESPRPEPTKVIYWTTEYILESKFNRESKIITVKTDRLGNFGFAYPRYTHFPFRNWRLEANDKNPDELIFTLDTHHVRVVFIICKDGIRGYATDVHTVYVAKPVKYMNIEKPVADFVELRKLFQDYNLNVFAELDAYFYIDQGYFCQKHLAAELHIYDAMTMHCKLLKFKHSDWNRLATDRDIVLCLRSTRDSLDSDDLTVRVTPEAATFVEVSELCSDNLDTIKLNYESTWRNIGTYTDLHQLINSMNPNAMDARNRDAGQMFFLRKLLQEIRPLSFS